MCNCALATLVFFTDLLQPALLEGVLAGRRASWAIGSEEAFAKREGARVKPRRGRMGEGKGKRKLCKNKPMGRRLMDLNEMKRQEVQLH